MINTIVCDGSESNVSECQIVFEGSESCGQYEDAGIVCQGKAQTSFNCVVHNNVISCRSWNYTSKFVQDW